MSSPTSPSVPGPALARSEFVARIAPFAWFIGVLALRGALPAELAFDARWLYALQAGGAAALLWVFWSRYAELVPARGPGDGVRLLEAVAVGLAIFGLWITLTAPWMRLGEPVASFVPTGADGQLRWDLIAVRLAGAVLVVPLMEELFWRSFLMRWIDRPAFLGQDPAAVSARAIAMSSAVFALAHDLWLAGLIAGLAFAWLYRRSGRLWVAVVAHAVANLALGAWVVATGTWSLW